MTEAKSNKELIRQVREIAAYAPPYRAMGSKVTSEMVLIALGTESIELADRLEAAEKTIADLENLCRKIRNESEGAGDRSDAEISRLRGLIVWMVNATAGQFSWNIVGDFDGPQLQAINQIVSEEGKR